MSPAKTILIIDDNESVVMALEFNMLQAGYKVLKALDGQRAFAIAQAEVPDIIISDITMPEMNGIELCEKVRAIPRLSEIPFIFLTAHGEPEERVRGLRTGADDYMVKPFDVEELILRIEILFRKMQKRRFSPTFSGSIQELSIPDTLQVFAQSRKQGKLIIGNETGNGILSFSDGTLMDAAFMDLKGEDALVELLKLDSGHFHFEPGPVGKGSLQMLVNHAVIETIRLLDEQSEMNGYIPDLSYRLTLKRDASVGDPDVQVIIEAIRHGYSTGLEAWKASGLSRIRTELALGFLIREGFVKVEEAAGKIARLEPDKKDKPSIFGKPTRILLSFTDENSASSFLEKTAEIFQVRSSHGIKSGVADFLKISVENVVMQILSLRGEKKFSFMWEPMLATSSAVIFLVNSAADVEHAAYFSDRLAKVKPIPFMPATMDGRFGDAKTFTIHGKEDIRTLFLDVLQRLNA